MRYAWDQFDAYFGPERVGAVASRWLYRPVLARLAAWDAGTAHRVHRFVANSEHVAARIRRYYNREATIVYPPVDTVFYQPARVPAESHFLIVSAFVPYKRIEIAIEACRRIGAPLRIVGDGPDRERLQRLSGPDVTFLGPLPDEQLRDEYQRARALIMPGEEDFGIVPVEAQACGRPSSRWLAGRARNRDRRRTRRAVRRADRGLARRRAARWPHCRSTPGGFARAPNASRAIVTPGRCGRDRRHAGRAGGDAW